MKLKKPRILFVDNEKESCISFNAVFRRDYKIKTTCEPLKVSGIIEQHNINIILTDYSMPMISGITLLEFIRNNYPSIYRILVTGSVDHDIMDQIL